MYWIKILNGKYKDYLGLVHDIDKRDHYNSKGQKVIAVQVEAPNFPWKEYTYNQIQMVKNPNNND